MKMERPAPFSPPRRTSRNPDSVPDRFGHSRHLKTQPNAKLTILCVESCGVARHRSSRGAVPYPLGPPFHRMKRGIFGGFDYPGRRFADSPLPLGYYLSSLQDFGANIRPPYVGSPSVLLSFKSAARKLVASSSRRSGF